MKILDISKIKLSKKDKYKCLNLPSNLSYELAYITGILAGDGSINQRKQKNEYLIKCVGNPKDEKEVYHNIIAPLFLKLFNLRLKIGYFDSKTTYGFIVYSKALFRFFTEVIGLPFGKKYSQLKIPNILKEDDKLTLGFIRGLIDTDACITFKRRYKTIPYYPVISICSKSKQLIKEIAEFLKARNFKIVEIYDYKVNDIRFKEGYSTINRLELNGANNFIRWMKEISFRSPKHIERIRKYWRGDSEGWI